MFEYFPLSLHYVLYLYAKIQIYSDICKYIEKI
nr:MAG TPA: hypothetical protein [Caudoviricetes sp.]DAP48020.1 MAG TPA: hypothetical protein [Caudoviricetes sp.]